MQKKLFGKSKQVAQSMFSIKSFDSTGTEKKIYVKEIQSESS